MALLLYMETLANWLNVRIKDAKKALNVCSYSVDVGNHILNSYTVSSANGR